MLVLLSAPAEPSYNLTLSRLLPSLDLLKEGLAAPNIGLVAALLGPLPTPPALAACDVDQAEDRFLSIEGLCVPVLALALPLTPAVAAA